MTAVPEKIRDLPGKPSDRAQLLDRLFFGFGTLASIWLVWDLARASLAPSWWSLLLLVAFWLVLAYLVLPRLNRILSSIYVPDYFIGRTRTSDGLLGDPLNLAFTGSGAQLSTAMRHAGWVKADPITLGSSVRIVTSTLRGHSYLAAPVSPLLLFGRPQDAAYQKEVAGNPGQRHHVRLWRTPPGWVLPGGRRVDWLAGGTYDRRVGLSLFTLQVTHKIDADIDVERDFITDSILRAEPAATIHPLVDFTTGYHSRNGGGDTLHTDGTLPVVDLTALRPAPDADPLLGSSGPPARVPLQVLLPAIIAFVIGPLAILNAALDWDEASSSERVLLGVVIALAASVAVCGAMMLRRSATARLWLLLLSSLIVLIQYLAYEVTDANGTRLRVIDHVGLTILIVLALSSPIATAWCRPRPLTDDADRKAQIPARRQPPQPSDLEPRTKLPRRR